MGQLTIRNPNPNQRIIPPPNRLLIGNVKILRRGEPPTAFENPQTTVAVADPKKKRNDNKNKKVVGFQDGVGLENYSPSSRLRTEPDMISAAPEKREKTAAAASANVRRKKMWNSERAKNVVGFRDGADLELYSTTCRIGPEPEMVPVLFGGSVVESPPASSLPLPLSLLRRAVV